MADKLPLYMSKSIAKWLIDNVSALDSAYVIGPEFDYDRKPSAANTKVERVLPFSTVELVGWNSLPFSVSKNILYESQLTYNIGVNSTNIATLMNDTADVRQALNTAKHPVSNKVGVPLYDYAVASGSYFDLVNAIDIHEFGPTAYFGPDDTAEYANMRHRSVTTIVFSAFKDKDATLLENLGNISINE